MLEVEEKKKAVIRHGDYGLTILFRFPSLALPKQVQRVSPPLSRAGTLSPNELP
jgi:hypothetical protein